MSKVSSQSVDRKERQEETGEKTEKGNRHTENLGYTRLGGKEVYLSSPSEQDWGKGNFQMFKESGRKVMGGVEDRLIGNTLATYAGDPRFTFLALKRRKKEWKGRKGSGFQ